MFSSKRSTCDTKSVFKLAWPIMLSMTSLTVMDVTDTIFMGYLGKTQLAGVAISSMVVFLIHSFFFGLLESIKIIIAQLTGAKKYHKHKNILQLGIIVAILGGLLTILLTPLADTIFYYFGGPEPIQRVAATYFSTRIFQSPFAYLMIIFSGFLQGKGNTKTPMQINILIASLNIFLDWILIFGVGPFPALGVQGSALATNIATFSGVLVMLYICKKDFTGEKFNFDFKLTKKLFSLGFPIGTRMFLEIASWTFLNSLVAKFSEIEIAANSIVIKIMCISLLPGWGIGEAACILAGQKIGSKDIQGVKDSFKSALKLCLLVMGSMGVVFFFFNKSLINIFQSDPDLIIVGGKLVIIMSCFQIFDAVLITAAGSLNGTGDTKFTMKAQILMSWFFMLPMAYFFGFLLKLGVYGIWFGITIHLFALAAITIIRFNSGAWQNKALV